MSRERHPHINAVGTLAGMFKAVTDNVRLTATDTITLEQKQKLIVEIIADRVAEFVNDIDTVIDNSLGDEDSV